MGIVCLQEKRIAKCVYIDRVPTSYLYPVFGIEK